MPFDFKSLYSNPAALAVGLSAAGGALGNRKETTTQTQNTNLTPEQQLLLKQLMEQQAKLSAGTDLTGYEAGQVSDINKTRALQLQNVQENAALRGITGDALGNAENSVDSQRYGDIVKLHQQIPMLQNQLETNALQTGQSLFTATPKNVVGTGTTPNNAVGGGLSNAAATLAYFLGQGAFKKPNASTLPSTVPNVYKTPSFNPGTLYNKNTTPPFILPSTFNINRTPVYNPGY
jgi:hypothetical protein